MPRGVVLFQEHDSARSDWTWVVDGRPLGVLVAGRGRRAVAAPGAPGGTLHTVRTVRLSDGTGREVGLDRVLSRSRENRAWMEADGRWSRAGVIVQRLARLPSGAVATTRDATGMFRRVARALADRHDTVLVPFTDTLADADEEHGSATLTANGVFASLRAVPGSAFDFFAYAGHGATDGLASAGIRQGDRIGDLAGELRRLLRREATVVLYACSTGHDGGFAQELSVLLNGMTVWGHDTPGTASRNPRKVRCRNGVREPIETLLPAELVPVWAQRLLESDLYLRFPFLSTDELIAELRDA